MICQIHTFFFAKEQQLYYLTVVTYIFSFTEKSLGVLVDTRLTRNQKCSKC